MQLLEKELLVPTLGLLLNLRSQVHGGLGVHDTQTPHPNHFYHFERERRVVVKVVEKVVEKVSRRI